MKTVIWHQWHWQLLNLQTESFWCSQLSSTVVLASTSIYNSIIDHVCRVFDIKIKSNQQVSGACTCITVCQNVIYKFQQNEHTHTHTHRHTHCGNVNDNRHQYYLYKEKTKLQTLKTYAASGGLHGKHVRHSVNDFQIFQKMIEAKVHSAFANRKSKSSVENRVSNKPQNRHRTFKETNQIVECTWWWKKHTCPEGRRRLWRW